MQGPAALVAPPLVSAFYRGESDLLVRRQLFVPAAAEVPEHILLAFVRLREAAGEGVNRKHVFLLPGVDRQFGFVLQRGTAWWCLLSRSCFLQLFFALLKHAVGDPDCVQAVNEAPLPRPGRPFSPRGDLALRMPKTRFAMGELNCKPLFEALPCDLVGKVFFLLMLERRVVLHASSVEKVSLCVHALVSLLYPFTYDHLLFFILPNKMADYLCAPFPYFCGLQSGAMETVSKLPLDAVCFCDLDKQRLSMTQADLTVLPPVQLNALVQRLERLRQSGFGTQSWNEGVQDAFLNVHCSLMASYRRYYMGVFDKEGFLADCPGSTKRFLTQFVEAQMFSSFLHGRREAQDDEFDRRCAEMTAGVTIKDLGKAINNFVSGRPKSPQLGRSQQQPSPRSAAKTSSPSSSPRKAPPSPSASPQPVRAAPPPVPDRTYLRRSQQPQHAVDLLGLDCEAGAARADLIVFDTVPPVPAVSPGDLICLEPPQPGSGGDLLTFE